MKISEMTNDQATDTLIRLAVPFGNICEDQETMKLLEDYNKIDDNVPLIRAVGIMLPQITTHLLKKHKEDLYEIIGALTFTSIEKVAKMKVTDTIKTLQESYDEVLRDFFTSSVNRIRKSGKKS